MESTIGVVRRWQLPSSLPANCYHPDNSVKSPAESTRFPSRNRRLRSDQPKIHALGEMTVARASHTAIIFTERPGSSRERDQFRCTQPPLFVQRGTSRPGHKHDHSMVRSHRDPDRWWHGAACTRHELRRPFESRNLRSRQGPLLSKFVGAGGVGSSSGICVAFGGR